MSETGRVALRDKRKPGHCWQDNEAYDVFQPVIGAAAIHVYAVLTRFARGHEVQMGIRDLEMESGTSRSAVARSLIAMEQVGMLRRRMGRGTAAAAYELLDLKEAARALGAEWSPHRASWVLPPARAAEIWRSLFSVSVRDAKSGLSVPQGDAAGCGKRRASVSVGDARGTLVSQNLGGCGSPAGHASSYRTKPKLQDNHPLPPPQAEGERRPDPDSGDLDLVPKIGAVMQGCGFTKPSLKRAISAQLRQEWDAGGEEAAARAAAAMIAAWRGLCENRHLLRYDWGAVKFFGEGHWRDREAWPWDSRALEAHRMRAEARVGAR